MPFLQYIGNESSAPLHIVPVRFAKKPDAFFFISQSGQKQKNGGQNGYQGQDRIWLFEVGPPCQEKQGRIERVPDIFINTCIHQPGGSFKRVELTVTPVLPRPPGSFNMDDPGNDQDTGTDQEDPGKDLLDRERFPEPVCIIGKPAARGCIPSLRTGRIHDFLN